jgi:gliding motility-associated-like protein
VVSDSGCTAVSQALITVNPQHQIYVPNAFTPNGDGINDYWAAFGNKAVWKFCEATVWDRWGEKVFQSNDIDFQWDGKYRGEYVEPGEYVYTFKVVFIDDYSVSNKGSITVIR